MMRCALQTQQPSVMMRRGRLRTTAAAWMGLLWLSSACGPGLEADTGTWMTTSAQAVFALAARCDVDVLGTGVVDVESDYLPHVVSCENGAADFQALKAQAVAARSYLYYRLATGDGTIRDGQADQVYTCAHPPGPDHYRAVAETAGEVLSYRGVEVAAFYVAGAIPSDRATCIAAEGDNDYSGTEPYVTPNWGFIGEGVEQTHLGWVNAGNYANRGCQSQNGAHCLAEAGWGYEDILLFYYGVDIEHVVAEGSCATPSLLPHSCGTMVDGESSSTIYDDDSSCFVSGCTDVVQWQEAALADNVHAKWLPASSEATERCFGRWRFSFSQAATMGLEVHIPEGRLWSSEARYTIVHNGRSEEVVVSQGGQPGWVSLGTFDFAPGGFQYLELTNLASVAGSMENGPYVVFDQVRLRAPGSDLDAGARNANDANDAASNADANPDADGSRNANDASDAALDGDTNLDAGDDLPECGCAATGSAFPAAEAWMWAVGGLGIALGRRRRPRAP